MCVVYSLVLLLADFATWKYNYYLLLSLLLYDSYELRAHAGQKALKAQIKRDDSSPTRRQRVLTVINRVVDLGIEKARNIQSSECLSSLGRIRF